MVVTYSSSTQSIHKNCGVYVWMCLATFMLVFVCVRWYIVLPNSAFGGGHEECMAM